MPELETFYLSFRTGLHVGRHGIGQEETLAHIPADTLFAALVTERARIAADADSWAQRFCDDPPLRLTSAFPYAGALRFYPRPVCCPAGLDPKAWRRIRYVSEGVLRCLAGGDAPAPPAPSGREAGPRDGVTLQGGVFWLTRDEVAQLPESMRMRPLQRGKVAALPVRAVQRQHVWVEDSVPRVTVDRITQASEIYHTGRVTFAPSCGLWFGVQWRDAAARDDLLQVLKVLGDVGIGAERSAGYGAFTWRANGRIAWPDPRPGGLMLLLSRYYPRAEEAETVLAGTGAAYELVHVTGYVRTLGEADQRRRGVMLVAEGGLVGADARGAVVDVRPTVGSFPHAVWRYGLALGIAAGGGA